MSDFEPHIHADEPNDDTRPLHLENLNESELTRVYEMIMDAQRLAGPLSSARYELIDKLERVEEAKLVKEKLLNERCSICYTPFGALVAEEEMMLAMDTPGASERALGVTRLQRCGHYFCRKDISKWILEGNDLCPYCRAPYLAPVNPSTTSNRATPANDEEDELEAAVRLFESQQSGGGAGQWRLPVPARAQRNGNSMYS